MLVKIITVINWIIIVILGYGFIMDTFFPANTGGEAAGRGIGKALVMLVGIVFIAMLILNLLPYNWAKYAALSMIALPYLYFKTIGPGWQNMKTKAKNALQEAKPIFEDKALERVARAIHNGEAEQVKQMLQESPLNQEGKDELTGYAIGEASGAAFKPEEKIECVRLLLENGGKPTSDYPLHIQAAETGNTALLRLLLEHGANANANNEGSQRPIIFEAVGAYRDPEPTVRLLLEFGAEPNATAIMDDEQGPITPLLWAAVLERWDVCATLLEKGAAPSYQAKNGDTLKKLMGAPEEIRSENGYSRRSDYERLKKMLR